MSYPKRTQRNLATSPPITPEYPSRVESLAQSKAVFHDMRNKLGAQHNRITALERDLAALKKLIIELQPATALKPREKA
jgi:uncharacterized protein involved in exopolysaccharide biosynthesis